MNYNNRHAYLIIAHNKYEQLKILVNLLDHPDNDIYIHIDKKSQNFSVNTLEVQYSNLFLIDSLNVNWGGYSLIKCEINLLKNAFQNHYMYYHLISGVDLPLKSQDEIHNFFHKHIGKNFIEFDEKANQTKSFKFRTQYYYLFQDIIGRNSNPWMHVLRKFEKNSLALQKFFHIKRRELIPLYKGANWVSITDELVQYILDNENTIKKIFSYSWCGDEMFIQSLAMNSPYRNTIVNNNCREIDWTRGLPYTYRQEDVPMLLASPSLFARKFDSDVDSEAIRLIVNALKNQPNMY